MNISNLSDTELVELIQAASAELATRLAEPSIQRIKVKAPIAGLRELNEEDKNFVLRLKTLVRGGGYATAAERDRVAALAEQGFGPWIKRQGLPTDRGNWAWRKLSETARIKPARER